MKYLIVGLGNPGAAYELTRHNIGFLVLDRMADWSAKMLSEYSHNDKPWKATDMNDIIDYELAFYREPPYSVRVYEEDEQDSI